MTAHGCPTRIQSIPLSALSETRRAALPMLRKYLNDLSRRSETAVPLGIAAIDTALPTGLMRNALHEIVPTDHPAIPAAFGFLIALVIHAIRDHQGAILWPMQACDEYTFGIPYASGLRAFGFVPDRLIAVRCRSQRDMLWAMEEGLRVGGLGAVIGSRSPRMTLAQARRLQLASATTRTPIFLLRRYDDVNPSPAVTRWRVAPFGSRLTRHGFDALRWKITLERVRGGQTGEWIVEWDHGAHALRLFSVLADRAVSADRVSRYA